MVDSCYIGREEDDDIDFAELKIDDNILYDKDVNTNNNSLLKSYKSQYVNSLREEYDADEILFEHIDALIHEVEDKDKLIKILDSL